MLSVINPITIAPSLYPSCSNVLGELGRKPDKAERRLTAGQTALMPMVTPPRISATNSRGKVGFDSRHGHALKPTTAHE